MTLIKGQEFRTILDFSKGKLSKNLVKQTLREVEVLELDRPSENQSYTFIENGIIVGMYEIRLLFHSIDCSRVRKSLKDYGAFKVAIFERNMRSKTLQNIPLHNDKRFKNQYWVELNKDYNLKITNLTDIIMYLKRLNELKMFL